MNDAKKSDKRKTWRERLRRGALELAVVAAIVVAISIFQTRNHVRGQVPDFSAPTLAGEDFSASALGGGPTVLAFFAPWCGVCAVNSGALGWTQSLSSGRVRVVHVAQSYRSVDEVRRYASSHRLRGTVVLGAELPRGLRVTSFPTYFFVNRDGVIRTSSSGYTTTAGMLLRSMF